MGRPEATPLDALSPDAVVRDEGDGQGGGMTGGVPSSVRAREAVGWVGFGAGWARPKDFLSF